MLGDWTQLLDPLPVDGPSDVLAVAEPDAGGWGGLLVDVPSGDLPVAEPDAGVAGVAAAPADAGALAGAEARPAPATITSRVAWHARLRELTDRLQAREPVADAVPLAPPDVGEVLGWGLKAK